MPRFSAFIAIFALGGCSAVDPGVDGLTRANLANPTQSGVDGGNKPPTQDGGQPITDAGGGLDSSTAADTSVATTAFTGAGAYTSSLPNTSAAQFHMNKGVNTVPGKGTACLGCHNGNAVAFLFAGTVFKDKAGTTPAANLEIRLRGNDGNGFITHSDNDGNFWLVKGNNTVVKPAMTGCRDSMNVSNMTGTLTDFNCNGCHDGNGTDPVHLP